MKIIKLKLMNSVNLPPSILISTSFFNKSTFLKFINTIRAKNRNARN